MYACLQPVTWLLPVMHSIAFYHLPYDKAHRLRALAYTNAGKFCWQAAWHVTDMSFMHIGMHFAPAWP